MVTDQPRQQVDRTLHALADATRRDILARTLRGEQSITALAGAYPMSFAAVHKHVAVLERAGLVSKHRHGREQLVRGEIHTVRAARSALDHFEDVWRGRFDRFGNTLADLTREEIP